MPALAEKEVNLRTAPALAAFAPDSVKKWTSQTWEEALCADAKEYALGIELGIKETLNLIFEPTDKSDEGQ